MHHPECPASAVPCLDPPGLCFSPSLLKPSREQLFTWLEARELLHLPAGPALSCCSVLTGLPALEA